MILQLQKGKLAFDFWFATLSGRTVGGLQGIRPISVFADFIYLEDVRECEKAIIELTWIGSGAADQAIIAEYGLPNIDAVAPGPPAGNLISDDTGTVITDDTGLGILGF